MEKKWDKMYDWNNCILKEKKNFKSIWIFKIVKASKKQKLKKIVLIN